MFSKDVSHIRADIRVVCVFVSFISGCYLENVCVLSVQSARQRIFAALQNVIIIVARALHNQDLKYIQFKRLSRSNKCKKNIFICAYFVLHFCAL